GRVRVQSSSTLDFFGNQTDAVASGCTEGCSASDEVITTHTEPGRPDNDPTGWLWRTVSSYVRGSAYHDYLGDLKVTTFEYDARGALTNTRLTLSNTGVLDRFHETNGASVAPTPSDASSNTTFLASTNTYGDGFGNVTGETGANNRCRTVIFDNNYSQLPAGE